MVDFYERTTEGKSLLGFVSSFDLLVKCRSFKNLGRIFDTGGLPDEQRKGVGLIWFYTN